MTFLQLCSLLREEVGAAGTGPSTVTSQTGEYARLVNYIANADYHIQGLWQDWDFMHVEAFSITTVAGTRAYTLDTLGIDTGDAELTRWDRASFVYQPATDNYQRLTYYPYKEWRISQRLGATLTQDVSTRVTIKPSNALVFDPVPNDVGPITADYWLAPIKMTVNSDQPRYPAHFHRLAVARAKMRYGAYEDAPEVYSEGKEEYIELLDRLESNQLPDQEHRRTSQHDLELVITTQ